MLIKLKGDAESRRVWLNEKEILPTRSQTYNNHSPDGFNWGYGGSGPAQLALAVCLELWDVKRKRGYDYEFNFDYQAFKFKYIAALPVGKSFEVEIDVIPHPYKPSGTLDV
jgi:hypothetical protein